MSDIKNFITDEKSRIDNIVIGLTQEEYTELNPDIEFLKSLLDLLGKTDISPTQKREIKKDIKKKVNDLDKQIKKERESNINSFTLGKNIKPNITEIPADVRDEALMVRASSLFHDNEDFSMTQDFLDDNKIPFKIDTELSNAEGLVLNNPETNETRLAFRGTKFNNISDWKIDAEILTGFEKENPQILAARKQVRDATVKYGSKPSKTLGYSKGGKIAIMVADAEGLDSSTTFNSFLGKNDLSNTETSTQHTLYRTTEDIPSILVGFKSDLDNYDIKTIRPLVDSLNPKKAHDLNNFYERGERATNSTLEDLVTNQISTGQVRGEAYMLADMKAHINNKTLITNYDDIRIIDKRIKTNDNPLVDSKFDPDIYNVENDMYSISDNPLDNIDSLSRQLEINYPTKSDLDFPEMYANKYDEFNEHGFPSSFEAVDDNFDTDEFIERMNKRMTALERNDVDDVIDNIRSKQTFNQPEHDFNSLKSINESKGEIIENDIKPLNPRTLPDLPEDMMSVTNDNFARLGGQQVKMLVPTKADSFTEWVHQFNSQRGDDTKINEDGSIKLNSNRMHDNSRHGKLWKELGKDFTPEEMEHFDYMSDVADSSNDLYLNKEQRTEFINANDDETINLLNKYHTEADNAMQKTDEYTTLPDENGDPHIITNDGIRGSHAMNFGIGLLSSYSADKLINMYDPLIRDAQGNVDESKQKLSFATRGTATGALAGAFTARALIALGQGGAELYAPEIVAGAVGGYTGVKTYQALRAGGLGENSASVISGGAGGAAAGASGALVAGGLSAVTGGEYGVAFAPETAGLSVVIGATIGAAIGEGSYLYGKYS